MSGLFKFAISNWQPAIEQFAKCSGQTEIGNY